MSKPGPREATGTGFAAVGVAAFAIACCAGGPLVVGALSGVAVGAVLGIGAGIVALAAVGGLAVVRARRRRACDPTGRPRP